MEDFVSFDLAKKLKEKGFDGKVSAYYKDTNKIFNTGNASNLNILTGAHSAPTISQVLKWLREEKRIEAGAVWGNRDGKWVGYVNEMDMPDLVGEHVLPNNTYDSYELAALAGIEYVLDNLI